ncbi:MAG: DinB family protein [Bacteroidota bacterium]
MEKWHQLFISDVKRRLFEESVPRIKKCLNMLTDEEIWYRPNENTNAIGNLVLHLNGNVRQWVLAGVMGEKDIRDRPREFNERRLLPAADLIALMDLLEADVRPALDRLTQEQLLEDCVVQNIPETGISALLHVVEHFSYHVGQITFAVKARKDVQTRYYDEESLN